MPLNDIGPVAFHQAQGVATLAFSPLNDRAAVVTKILVDKVSAGDIWRVTTTGRELAAFDIQTTGNQQPLSGPYSGYPNTNDLFELYADSFGEAIIFPVPNGMTLTIASDGGATANIAIEYVEMSQGEISSGMMNHPQGRRIVTPLVGYRAATVTTLGEQTFDTQVGPKWFPNIFVDNNIPPRWNFKILAAFLEGGGSNSYVGSADQLSTTTYFGMQLNGQQYWSRDSLAGIPLVGKAAATGSDNDVVGTDLTPCPPFQEADEYDWKQNKVQFNLNDGMSYKMRLAIAGALTTEGSYAGCRQLFVCDVMTP